MWLSLKKRKEGFKAIGRNVIGRNHEDRKHMAVGSKFWSRWSTGLFLLLVLWVKQNWEHQSLHRLLNQPRGPQTSKGNNLANLLSQSALDLLLSREGVRAGPPASHPWLVTQKVLPSKHGEECICLWSLGFTSWTSMDEEGFPRNLKTSMSQSCISPASERVCPKMQWKRTASKILLPTTLQPLALTCDFQH